MSSTTSGILIAAVLTTVGGSNPTSLGFWNIDDAETPNHVARRADGVEHAVYILVRPLAPISVLCSWHPKATLPARENGNRGDKGSHDKAS